MILALALWGCGTSPLDLDNDILSDMLSLSNRTRRAIQDPADPSRIIGLAVEVDIINVGTLPIDLPFTMTWSLLDGQGNVHGSASTRVDETLAPGARRHVSLTLNFPAIPSLEGFSDAVTFDLISQPSN